ncbi:MAG: site-2 protease family protein [Anaerolineales bacterium]|nr:site-2 protease family protein [Anaerolineales bacterium]
MDANIKLGRIWGIPIGLHASWFLIFGLLTWSLAAGYFPGEYPGLNTAAHLGMAVVTSLLFFGSVLAHELGHSFVALRSSIPVKGITLFIFGGVAQIGQEPRSPRVEFKVAIAGPAVSLALALGFYGLYLLDRSFPVLAAPSQYLMRINLMLALFNLIPGFPLDGGRVLRSIVWRMTGSFQRASRVASFSGQLVAFGFIAYGVYAIFRGDFMNGLWLAFIGWFLQNAAASSYAQTSMQQSLRGIRVEQVMSRDCLRVPSLLSLNQLVEDRILSGGKRCFFVADNGKLQGMLTLRDIAAVPQQKWRFTTTAQAMVPLQRLVQVTPQTELLSALQTMDSADVAQVPVMEGEELVGMLSREQILRYLRTRAELGI